MIEISGKVKKNPWSNSGRIPWKSFRRIPSVIQINAVGESEEFREESSEELESQEEFLKVLIKEFQWNFLEKI